MAELHVGDPAPSFSLPDQHGTLFSLDAARQHGPVVVFFYPKDGTPGCTAEVCSFRDASTEFKQAGATVVGVSSDAVGSHRQFADRYQVDYPLLADQDGHLREQFGVPRGLMGLLDGRVTYVIDREGIIRHRFVANFRFARHVGEALNTVRKLANTQ